MYNLVPTGLLKSSLGIYITRRSTSGLLVVSWPSFIQAEYVLVAFIYWSDFDNYMCSCSGFASTFFQQLTTCNDFIIISVAVSYVLSESSMIPPGSFSRWGNLDAASTHNFLTRSFWCGDVGSRAGDRQVFHKRLWSILQGQKLQYLAMNTEVNWILTTIHDICGYDKW